VKKLLEGPTPLNLLMLGFAVYCLIAAFGYGPKSRIFPIAIGIPTVILLALSIAAVWKPAILKGAEVHLGESSSTEKSLEDIGETKYAPSHVAAMMAWLIFAGLAVGLIGFRFAVPLFILLFARFEGRANWLAAILVALVTSAFIVGYFDVFMSFGMFRGIIFGEMLPLY
jgi:hypothetical protein